MTHVLRPDMNQLLEFKFKQPTAFNMKRNIFIPCYPVAMNLHACTVDPSKECSEVVNKLDTILWSITLPTLDNPCFQNRCLYLAPSTKCLTQNLIVNKIFNCIFILYSFCFLSQKLSDRKRRIHQFLNFFLKQFAYFTY